MKKPVSLFVALLVVFVVAGLSLAGSRGKMDVKLGDEVYVCACGEACGCQTMSSKAGQCSCGKDLVLAKAVFVEGGVAQMRGEGWESERPFQLAAKYACACPPECPCNTQSQKPGKCACGKEMKAVE
jgi:hypothetical protein